MSSMQTGLLFRVRRAAKQIAEQHRHIGEVQGRLESALAGAARDELKQALNRYRGAVDAHFSLEEEVFFPALHGLHPEQGAALERLSAEHGEFTRALEALERELDGDARERFGEALRRLVDRMAEHESREERLVRSLAELPTEGG